MSKRSSKTMSDTETTTKKRKHWSLGLLESMKDEQCIYKESDKIVVIKDKYPKAKVHYLVLPRDEISSIYNLNKSHVNLLLEFSNMLNGIKKDHSEMELKAGFHAVPSMQRLHMHVISKDMISQCLKTKIHWNSFTTKFFIPYEEVLNKIKEEGSITRMSKELHKELMATPLKCNQCNFVPKNMPNLKEHLLTHDKL